MSATLLDHISSVLSQIEDQVTVYHSNNTNSVSRDRKSVLVYDTLLCTCPSQSELVLNLGKRLDSRRHSASVRLSSVAIVILCSSEYSVNHVTVPVLTVQNMQQIWGTIETISVSSTPELSEWILKALNGRSQDGYMAYTTSLYDVHTPEQTGFEGTSVGTSGLGRVQNKSSNDIPRPRGAVLQLNQNVFSIKYGSGSTINEIAEVDSAAVQSFIIRQSLNIKVFTGYYDYG